MIEADLASEKLARHSAADGSAFSVDSDDTMRSSETKQDMLPMMNYPAAAILAATNFGLSMGSQWAGLWLDAMQALTGAHPKKYVAEEKPKTVIVAMPLDPDAEDQGVKAKSENDPLGETQSASPTVMDTQGISASGNIEKEVPGSVLSRIEEKLSDSVLPIMPEGRGVVAFPATEEMLIPARTSKPKRSKAMRPLAAPADDLKRISGIGPKLEQVLQDMGIRRYADIASWTDADVQNFDDRLSMDGRIAGEGWVDQAKSLIVNG